MVDHSIEGMGSPQRVRLLGAMVQADFEDRPLHLDFAPLDRGDASKRRLAPTWWVPSISNLLLGRYMHLPIQVTLPTARSIQVQLLRGGLYFALAQRTGTTEYRSLDSTNEELLERSCGEWNPRQGEVLFPVAETTRAEERLFLYANTHVRTEAGYFRRFEGSAAFPWLGEAIPRPLDNAAKSIRSLFIAAVSQSFSEVLDNATIHAFNLRDTNYQAGWLGSRIVDQARSSLFASVTEGGSGSYNRLHFLSLDNGFGLARTLRWQHPDQLRHAAAGDLVREIFTHRLGDRAIRGHNGAGLWYLAGLARFAGGTITVITEDDQSDGQAAIRLTISIPPGEDPAESRLELIRDRVPIRGTLIHTQLEIPRLQADDSERIQERVREFYRFRPSELANVGS